MKDSETVYPVKVWSKWLRISHWLMAGSTLALIISGWMLEYIETTDPLIRDYHFIFGHLLLLSLLLRAVLSLRPIGEANETEHWKTLSWSRIKRMAMLDMLKYYMSLGRMPKPAYYAHSPLWLPFYSIVLVLLLIQTASGYFYDAPIMLAGIGLWKLHGSLASLLEILVSLHIISAVIQDMGLPGGDISGMISGHRLFSVEKPTMEKPDENAQLVKFDMSGGKK